MNPLEPPTTWTPPTRSSADLAFLKARLFKARATLVEASPFLGALVLRTPILITEDPALATAGVDGYGTCHFALAFLEALDLPALRAVLLHETLHLALDAFPRCGPRKPLRWNVAHDFAVNQLIADSGFAKDFLAIPKAFQPLLDPRFRGLPAEEVYDRLPEDLGELGLDDPACLRDAVERMTPGERAALGLAIVQGFDPDAMGQETFQAMAEALGRLPQRLRGPMPAWPDGPAPVLERLRNLFPPSFILGRSGDLDFDAWAALAPALQDALRESWREKLLEAAEQALGDGRDLASLPGWARNLLGPMLNPRIPWQAQLAQRIHGHLRGQRRSFARPGRRSDAAGATLPGPIRDRGPVGVFLDVSGSVGPQDLGAFLGELGGILQGAGVPVRLITWDTAVQEDLLLDTPDDLPGAIRQGGLRLQGGGGTDPRCVMAHLDTLENPDLPPLDFAVLLTDGQVPWPDARDWPLDLLLVCTDRLPDPRLGYDALHLDLAQG